MKVPKAHALALLLIWLAATAFNLTKAVHIDDTAYLEIARHIRRDPLHPLSGTLNWGDTAEPMHKTNQPVLLFYLFAATMAVFGESELALHLAMAAFALAAILAFHALAEKGVRYFFPEKKAPDTFFLTAMFALGPVFIPSQNLMTDVPMTALWLWAVWALLAGQRYPLAAALVAAACLTKYTSLVLIPLLALAIVLRRDWRALWTLAIPVGALAAWSLFNLYDYGGVHLLARPAVPLGARAVVERGAAWVVGLGAVSPFSMVALPYLWRRGRVALLACGLFAAAAFAWGVIRAGETAGAALLRAAFVASGLVLLAAVLRRPTRRPPERADLLLLAWLVGSAGFIILFSPFLAVRHYLPTLPVVLLLLGRTAMAEVGRTWRYAALATTALLGALLGVSDWQYAHLYRVQARQIREEWPGGEVWFVGHWGWQWYARKAGMRVYDARDAALRPGDLVVAPELAHQQVIAPRDRERLSVRARTIVAASPGTFLRTVAPPVRGGYYWFSLRVLPWTFSTQPLETFTIYDLVR